MKNRGRRTITMDAEIENKLRSIQAQLIQSTGKNWSMSTVANVVAFAGILSAERMKGKDLDTVAGFASGNVQKLGSSSAKKYAAKLGKRLS